MPSPGSGNWYRARAFFGSDELSAMSPALAELVSPGFIELCPADAAGLGIDTGDGVEVGDQLATLELRVNDSMAAGCAGYGAGLAGTGNLRALARVSLRRAETWQRRPGLIASDQARAREQPCLSSIPSALPGHYRCRRGRRGNPHLVRAAPARRVAGPLRPQPTGAFRCTPGSGRYDQAADQTRLVPPFADRAVFVFAPPPSSWRCCWASPWCPSAPTCTSSISISGCCSSSA